MQTMQVAIEFIALHVKVQRQKQYKALKQDITSEGLTNPIIVMPNSRINYDEAIRNVQNIDEYKPNRQLLAYNGNQRLSILEELGYYSVTCFIVDNVRHAHILQLQLQNGIIINELAS
jgi:hypothetical protein